LRPEDLELAAEFCKMVGAPNLLAYLGLDEHADPVEARGRLKARRKFMQGMQSNPKYKREALFLIKNFTSLNELLNDLPEYLADARRRAESEHLPVIEMTVRGVLAGGQVTEEQIAYLRRNALELGVSEVTFRELLQQVGRELGLTFDQEEPTPAPVDGVPLDLYQLLGISTNANEDDVRIAYHRRLEELDGLQDMGEQEMMRRRIEIARKVLENEAARRHYDLTAARTGPPARAREVRPDQSATAPPAQDRAAHDRAGHDRTFSDRSGRPTGIPRLEILGDPVRSIRPGQTVTIAIRNGGEGLMHGTVTPDVRWLKVEPTRLDPSARQQNISVTLLRQELPPASVPPPEPGASPQGTGPAPAPPQVSVTIETERGERARVVFEIRRGLSPLVWAAAVVALLLLGALLVQVVLMILG
jgi:hypothetical protein